MKLALLLLIAGCSSYPVPMTSRPDTRQLDGIFMDSSAIRVAIQTFQSAYPNEAAVCFYGVVKDTLWDNQSELLVMVRSAGPAVADSADPYHVWFPRGSLSGCQPRGLIGVGHAHQHANASRPCAHSDVDAWALLQNRPALFSMVFCSDGRLQVLWQDGRRSDDAWIKAVNQP